MPGQPTIAMYDESGRRVSDDMEREIGTTPSYAPSGATGATYRRGIYDVPDTSAGAAGTTWTRGEFVGEGQGSGPHKDTGKYDADQWAGTTQRPGETPGNEWTSGEFVGEGQGSGPHKDTGEYDAKQWVGEGQGDRPASDDEPTKRQA
jgi:hypothetical protein